MHVQARTCRSMPERIKARTCEDTCKQGHVNACKKAHESVQGHASACRSVRERARAGPAALRAVALCCCQPAQLAWGSPSCPAAENPWGSPNLGTSTPTPQELQPVCLGTANGLGAPSCVGSLRHATARRCHPGGRPRSWLGLPHTTTTAGPWPRASEEEEEAAIAPKEATAGPKGAISVHFERGRSPTL